MLERLVPKDGFVPLLRMTLLDNSPNFSLVTYLSLFDRDVCHRFPTRVLPSVVGETIRLTDWEPLRHLSRDTPSPVEVG